MVKQLPKAEWCPRCEWRYPTFHICLDLPKEIMRKIEDGIDRDSNGQMISKGPKPRQSRAKDRNLSHNEAISAGIRAKFENDTKRQARDKNIERLYVDQELSLREIANEVGLSQKTVMSALHRARDAGRLTMRPAARRVA